VQRQRGAPSSLPAQSQFARPGHAIESRSPGQHPPSAALRVANASVRAAAPCDGPFVAWTIANRGTCDALAAHHNTARPDTDSSLAGPAIACMHHRQTASQQSPRLTANLLDPLVAPHCSLTPPPRYCTQLHTRQPHSWLPSAALIPPSHLPVRPSKGAKKFFLDSFRIVFERFEGFSRKRNPSPPNWILKHEYAARESAFFRTAR
jgi:hypothetical protein